MTRRRFNTLPRVHPTEAERSTKQVKLRLHPHERVMLEELARLWDSTISSTVMALVRKEMSNG